MTPFDQTVFSDMEAGTRGNCFQAVVASMLELPMESVPHFFEDGCDSRTFRHRVNAFLRPMNLAFIDTYPIDLDHEGIAGLHHDQEGFSPRNIYHSVVAVDGSMAHDPHPTHVGLKEVATWGVFIVLDPSKPAGVKP